MGIFTFEMNTSIQLTFVHHCKFMNWLEIDRLCKVLFLPIHSKYFHRSRETQDQTWGHPHCNGTWYHCDDLGQNAVHEMLLAFLCIDSYPKHVGKIHDCCNGVRVCYQLFEHL